MTNKKDPIVFKRSSLKGNRGLLDEYVEQISIPYDDFLEDKILSSEIYSVLLYEEHIGFCGIQDKTMNIFYIRNVFFEHARSVFSRAKEEMGVTVAFIPTTDIAALSVVLEEYTKIQIQALHFSDTTREVRPARFSRDKFRLAVADDLQEINTLADDFLDDYELKVKNGEIYVLEEKNELLGIGVFIQNKIMKNCVGTGMYTKKTRRKEGVGRSIILHLKEIAYDQGMIPVPGCWYYNTNSRRTLESAGYITQSKLLKVTL
jgi:hypothetical protein